MLQERFGPVRTRLTLAGFLLTVSGLLFLFVMLDNERLYFSQRLGVVMDAAALLSAALFFDYVYTSVSPRSPSFWPYSIVAAYLIITALNGGRILAPTAFAPIVGACVLASALALAAYVRNAATLPLAWKIRPEYRRLPVLLGGIGVFHVAQVLRLVGPNEALLFDLVPFLGSLGLLAFTVYGLIGSQTLRTLATVRQPTVVTDHLGPLLDSAMASERVFLDPDLSLPKAAGLLGVSPNRLSTHLNADRGTTFRAYVNHHRIEEAKRLLSSPDETRTSIEAIALMSGFRSRSSFYTAFQSLAGVSPQDYRRKNPTAGLPDQE